jgi:hypothetical protein
MVVGSADAVGAGEVGPGYGGLGIRKDARYGAGRDDGRAGERSRAAGKGNVDEGWTVCSRRGRNADGRLAALWSRGWAAAGRSAVGEDDGVGPRVGIVDVGLKADTLDVMVHVIRLELVGLVFADNDGRLVGGVYGGASGASGARGRVPEDGVVGGDSPEPDCRAVCDEMTVGGSGTVAFVCVFLWEEVRGRGRLSGRGRAWTRMSMRVVVNESPESMSSTKRSYVNRGPSVFSILARSMAPAL